MKGHASILSLRFRIYGDAFLPQLERESTALSTRLRLYPPFRVRAGGSPLSPVVPFGKGQDFWGNPRGAVADRLKPPQALTPQPMGRRAYDALRVDAWGATPEASVHEAVPRILRWWRYLTLQPW